MICTWLIDSDQFESAQVVDAGVSAYFKQEIDPNLKMISTFLIRTAWNTLARGGQIRAAAPSFREWRPRLR